MPAVTLRESQPWYIATETFTPSHEGWTKYIAWSGLTQLDEVVSLDPILCPSLLSDIKAEYWPHIVNEDFMLRLSEKASVRMSRHRSILPTEVEASVGVFCVMLLLAGCGGSPSSPTTPSNQPAPPITVYDPGNGVSLPTVIREMKPSYTAQALAARIQGTALLSAVVLADGTVGDVTVIRSLDTVYGLDAQAVSAAKQWLFNPGTKDGVAVAVRVSIEFTFTLA